MSKLVVLVGLPASGKSTEAEKLVANGGFIRLNRDLLREMIDYGKYSGKNEARIVDLEKSIARANLVLGTNVVIDDCNLNPKNIEMWKSVAHDAGAKFEIVRMETSVEECISRDMDRPKSVGVRVILEMALQYGLFTIDKPVVICDIDGTIADIEHRREWASGDKKDWQKFFSLMDKDTVREDVRRMLYDYKDLGYEIIFVSARPEEYREVTENWLAENLDMMYGFLFMRSSGDSREDSIVKKQIYDKYLKDMKIIGVIDDRPRVIRMWRELGLEVIDVGNGIEF